MSKMSTSNFESDLNNNFTTHLVCAKFGIHNLPQSLDIGQNSEGVISDFQISGQSLIKENCHNSRTSDDVDMKLVSETELDKRNKKKTSKNDNDVMSENCDVTDIFLILANLKQSGDRMLETESAKVMFSLTVTFCLTKTENRAKNSLTQLSQYCFE